jgi:enoyl-[acyl-carrier protein] reductase II
MIHTELCDLLNIKHPIVQAGMGPFTTTNLAVAVSNAGALGLISHAGGPLFSHKKSTMDMMKEAIDAVNRGTKNTFGINVRVAKEQPDAPKLIDMICESVKGDSSLEKKLRVVITSAGDPTPPNKKLKAAGILHFHVAPSAYHAQKVEKVGCDGVIASGYEAGGHIARVPVHTFVLVPAAVKAVRIPVVAAGGMCDGASLAAALAFGASGIQMGTRFIATKESDFLPNYKEAFLKAAETDTTVLPGFFSEHCRYLQNEWTKTLEKMITEGKSEMDMLPFKVKGRKLAAEDGDGVNGSLLCGMVVGRVKDLPSVKELVERTVKEAEEIIGGLPEKIKK